MDLRPARVALCLFLAGQAAPVIAGQMAHDSQRVAGAALSPADRDAVLAAVRAALRSGYVFPEKVDAILASLETARKAGRYDIEDAGLLAERLSEDLRAASGDRHLYMLYDPAQYAASMVPPAAAGAAGAEDSAAFERRMAERAGQGLAEERVLPGNIRYLKISQFWWVNDETGAWYDSAMRFLRGGDAIIIDLRGNPGGSHAAVRYLVSHFMDGDALEMTFLASGKAPEQSRTLEHLPAGRLTGKPLYVLIDHDVGSAAEAFAYDVAQFRLGELVGATTAGAANNNRFVSIAPGFMLSLSYGRPVHPVSGTNWDGTGVVPTVSADPARALEAADTLALTRLLAAPGGDAAVRAERQWALDAAEAALNPVTLPAARLKGFAGHYGLVRVTLRDGALVMARAGRPDRRLAPLTADGLFAVEGSTMLRVRFKPGALDTLWMGDPEPRSFKRD